MRCAPSLSRKTAIFERQTRKCPFRKRERTKSYVTAFLPHRKYFRRGSLCGRGFDAVSRQYTPQNIRFAGAPDSAVENAVIRMRCKEKASFSRGAYLVVRNPQFCPTENAFGGGPKTRKAPADGQERTIYRTWMFSPQALDKAIRQYTPQNIRFAGTPDFYPTKNPYGFYAGTTVLLIIVCKNRDIWMKCAKAPIFRTRSVLGVRKRSEYGG